MSTHTPESFWKRIDIKGSNDCWLWTGAQGGKGIHEGKGYGSLSYQKKMWRAHRLAYTLTHGPIDSPMTFVCHSCDTPLCCNPAHLWLGTNKDNILDSMAKGRFKLKEPPLHIGEEANGSKLTEAQVREIRSLADTMSYQEIGILYHIHRTQVGNIVRRKYWKHIL